MSCAVGNITRLLTRNCYAALEQRISWHQPLDVSLEIRNELLFWQNNIDSINGKHEVYIYILDDLCPICRKSLVTRMGKLFV